MTEKVQKSVNQWLADSKQTVVDLDPNYHHFNGDIHVPTNDFEDMVLESDVSAVMDVPPEGSINNVFEYCLASVWT